MSKLRMMKVQSGSLRWTGKAASMDHAIIQSLATLPDSAGELLRIHDGARWHYIAFEAALKIAGHSDVKIITKGSRGQ